MAVTFYLMPGVTSIDSHGDTIRSGKYFETTLAPYAKGQLYMGLQDTWLVGVTNISGADDATLVADALVTKIPPFANTIGAGAIATVKSKLEALNIPADFVTQNMTYATLTHYVVCFCLFMQVYSNTTINGPLLFDGTDTLDTQFQNLSAAKRTALLAAANQLKLSTAGMGGTTKVRTILKGVGDQWTQVVGPIFVNGVQL